MNCAGSISLVKMLALPESEEKDYQRDGIALHEAAAECLREKLDAWEVLGHEFHGVKISEEFGEALQTYLDTVAPKIASADRYGIEDKYHNPAVHPAFYGTSDFWAITGDLLDLTDAKFGRGIVVEPQENPQLMIYAYDKLVRFPEIVHVVLRIVQPLAFHHDGPIREWKTPAENIRQWAQTKLLPAMNAAEMDGTLTPGTWCRFCPAKLHCPALHALWKAAVTTDPKSVPALSDEMLGLNYGLKPAVESFMRALEEEAFARLNAGKTVPGAKLVLKRANRVWKPDAEEEVRRIFGQEAYTSPELKSPAKIDALGPKGKSLTAEHAFTPDSGFSVALDTDGRMAIKVKSASETFAHIKQDTQEKPK